jgi:hypothetical protein
MKAHFVIMAQYNAWANERLYRMAGTLPDDLYRKDVGAYFKSLHGTFNHLLTADRIWMRRLTGVGDHPDRLDAIVFGDLQSLGVIIALDGFNDYNDNIRGPWSARCQMPGRGARYHCSNAITTRLYRRRTPNPVRWQGRHIHHLM